MSLVLLGKLGSGKTTLYNKLTSSNEKTKYGGLSLTRQVFMKQSSFGRGFKVMDTPGYGAEEDKIKHVAGVLAALAEGPLNRICLVVKFERIELAIQNTRELLSAFMNFRVMITVILTFWDLCDKQEEQTNKNEISRRLEKLKINSVIFVGHNDSAENLCKQFDDILSQSQAQKIELSPDDIYRNFDMNEYDPDQLLTLMDQKQQAILAYRKLQKQAVNLIEETKLQNDELSDYLNTITEFSQKYVEVVVGQFEKDSLKEIDSLSGADQLKGFQVHLDLKIELFDQYEMIVQKQLEKSKNTANHFSNSIKKCIHCGEVWIKVQGCDQETICGRQLNGKSDQTMKHGIPSQYAIKYEKGKLEITLVNKIEAKKKDEAEIQKTLQQNEKSKQNQKKAKESDEVIGMGCGRKIIWHQMKNLTQEELEEILKVMDKGLHDYLEKAENLAKQKTKQMQIKFKQQLEEEIKKQMQDMKVN